MSVRFGINHMCAPAMRLADFFAMARLLGVAGVEIRNDLAGNAILDGTPPAEVRALAEASGITILSINALQRFNEWNATREREARDLATYASACGAKALVLVPTNDGSGRANGERQANLRVALKGLAPILASSGILGLVEPLGFETCALRLKSEAAEAIRALRLEAGFRLVHDTFHHHLAGEREMFPDLTGLIHVSGVSDPDIGVEAMRDPHRVLVTARDRLGNAAQVAALTAGNPDLVASFEPFSPEVHASSDIAADLRRSMDFITGEMRRAAA